MSEVEIKVVDYVLAADRNNPDEVRAHYYAKTDEGGFWPMCGYGWNRSDGSAFSILRGWGSARGICKLCEGNVEQRLLPVTKGFLHKTKWI